MANLEDVERAVVLLTGVSSLDPTIKSTIKADLQRVDLAVASEKLFPEGIAHLVSSSQSASALNTKAPVASLLVIATSGIQQKLASLGLAVDGEAPSTNSEPSQAMQGLHVMLSPGDIEQLFPQDPSPIPEMDTSLSTSSESVMTPENEKRVFTYFEPVEVAEDDLAGELPLIVKSPVDGRRSTIGSPSQQRESFRARPVPASLASPFITPRLSKAAALRMGISLSESQRPANRPNLATRAPPAPDRPVTPPRSLARPSLTPRQTKASLLRASGEKDDGLVLRPATVPRQSFSTSERSAGYEGTPGYGGRRIAVASTSNGPSIVPRTSKAAELRKTDPLAAPLPKPTTRRQSLSTAEMHAAAKVNRRLSVPSLSMPSTSPRPNRASTLRASKLEDVNDGPEDILLSRTRAISPSPANASRSSNRLSISTMRASISPSPMRSPGYSSHSRESTSSTNPEAAQPTNLRASQRPQITPRANKAAELRSAARKAAEAVVKPIY